MNEATERLREALASVRGWREPSTITDLLNQALAHERQYLDTTRLAAALEDSGLLDRLRDYFMEAHPDRPAPHRGLLMNEWTQSIAAEYARSEELPPVDAEQVRRLRTRLGGPHTPAGRALLHDLSNGYQPTEGYPTQLSERIALIEKEAAAIDTTRLAEAIWNKISVKPHEGHDSGECERCDTWRSISRTVVDESVGAIAAEYAQLGLSASR